MAEAAGRVIEWKKCLKKLKAASANSPETAVSAEKAGIEEDWILKDLLWFGDIKRTEDGRYYVECKDGKHC
jgi:NADH/NAD ratio-sensing transcriptional regulator Rex